MGSPTYYACCRKEMLGWICEKWILKNQPHEVAGFLPSVQPSLEMALQFTAARALQVKEHAVARAL
jgi:hypothetical protein